MGGAPRNLRECKHSGARQRNWNRSLADDRPDAGRRDFGLTRSARLWPSSPASPWRHLSCLNRLQTFDFLLALRWNINARWNLNGVSIFRGSAQLVVDVAAPPAVQRAMQPVIQLRVALQFSF